MQGSTKAAHQHELDDLDGDEEGDGHQVGEQQPVGDQVHEVESNVGGVVALAAVVERQVVPLLACTVCVCSKRRADVMTM